MGGRPRAGGTCGGGRARRSGVPGARRRAPCRRSHRAAVHDERPAGPRARDRAMAPRRAAAKAPEGSTRRSSTRCWRAPCTRRPPSRPTSIRGVTSSGHGVETVEALAGTGKTFTAGPAGRGLHSRRLSRPGGGADGTRGARAHRAGRHRPGVDADAPGARPRRRRPRLRVGSAVLIVDEAGMASTRETARVMAHARTAGVKVIAIGDSGQLSSVQAGGWLGSLTRRLGSHELREVMRQRDPRERQLLAQRAPRRPHRLHRREGRTRPVAHLRRRCAAHSRRRARGCRRVARPPGRLPVGASRPDRA